MPTHTILSSFPRPRFAAKASAALLAASLGIACLHAGAPKNLGLGLDKLTSAYEAKIAATGSTSLTHNEVAELKKTHPTARLDATDRVLVDVYFNGRTPIDEAIRALQALGGTVVARADWYRHGAVSVYVPLAQATKVGLHPGVDTVNLSLKPMKHVGLATSGGTKVLKSDVENAKGYVGTNITVGVMSDSFNTAQFSFFGPPATVAADDVTTDDLPGTGNPAGHTTPVYVLEDYGNANDGGGTDEGRAMCQIVHDVAPASNIAFATAYVSEIGFAQNIIALATPKSQKATISTSPDSTPTTDSPGTASVAGGGCQVVCDDIQYFDEPMFSDGIVGQAVDAVSSTYGVSYFSSAGNDGSSGYAATFTPVANDAKYQGALLTQGNINYGQIPAEERAAIASFHSFGTDKNGLPILVQRVKIPLTGGTDYPGVLVFQWDDPFNKVDASSNKQVTTDYDLLVFSVDSTGATTYEPDLSGTSVNGGNTSDGTNQPIELTGYFDADVQYEFVIVHTNRAPATGVASFQAKHIRWAMQTDAAQVVADFTSPTSPNTFGHTTAASCNSAAAYVYDNGFDATDAVYHPSVEAFSSNGPAIKYFDAAGNRLANAVTRLKPTLSTTDGVDTTFFGSDSDGDGFPNFFGTSAASPHGAGCAALLLGVARSRGVTLTPAEVTSLLTTTTQGAADQDPAVSSTTVGPVTLTAQDRGSYTDANAYTITLAPNTKGLLTKLTFDQRTDTQPTQGFFVPSAYPLTLGGAGTTEGGAVPSITSYTLSSLSKRNSSAGQVLGLTFNNFTSGDNVVFGIASTNVGDTLEGAAVTASVNGTTYTGVMKNTTGTQWNYKSGYGLVDVKAAIDKLVPTLPKAAAAASEPLK